jgi:hypothetical protein
MSKNLTEQFEGKQFTDFRDMPNYPYVSDRKSVFYAGDDGKNFNRAESYAIENNMVRIHPKPLRFSKVRKPR